MFDNNPPEEPTNPLEALFNSVAEKTPEEKAKDLAFKTERSILHFAWTLFASKYPMLTSGLPIKAFPAAHYEEAIKDAFSAAEAFDAACDVRVAKLKEKYPDEITSSPDGS